MSFLTALGYLAGGLGQGLQQRRDNQFRMQQLADQHAYEQAQIAQEQAHTGIEQAAEQRAADTYQRNLGIDPKTGKPFVMPQALTQIAPGNKGRQATPEQLAQHYWALAQYYAGTGQADKAAAAQAQAAAVTTEIVRQQAIEAQNQRDLYNESQQNQRTADIIAGALDRTNIAQSGATGRTLLTQGGENARQQVTQQGLNARQQKTIAGENQRAANTIAAANQRNAASVAQRYDAEFNNDYRDELSANAKEQAKGNPPPYPALADFQKNLSLAIAGVTSDPKRLRQTIAGLNSLAKTYGPELIRYGIRALENAARDAQQSQIKPGTMLVPQGNPNPVPAAPPGGP